MFLSKAQNIDQAEAALAKAKSDAPAATAQAWAEVAQAHALLAAVTT